MKQQIIAILFSVSVSTMCLYTVEVLAQEKPKSSKASSSNNQPKDRELSESKNRQSTNPRTKKKKTGSDQRKEIPDRRQSQTKNEDTKNEDTKNEDTKNEDTKKFVDRNGDGIHDGMEYRFRRKQSKRDPKNRHHEGRRLNQRRRQQHNSGQGSPHRYGR